MGRNNASTLITALLLAGTMVFLSGCGGGGGGGGHGGGQDLETNPGTDLVGLWSGTFSDQYGDYTIAMEMAADDLIPAGDPAWAEIIWGEESLGFEIQWGEFVEEAPGHYSFEYDTYDFDGNFQDTVSGDLYLLDADYAEGSFTSTSGTFGDFSLALSPIFAQDFVAGSYDMVFSDPVTRDTFYLGEVELDDFGSVVAGAGSYLTDDTEGPIDPGANVWPITSGYLDLVDADTGYYQGELFFASPDDTIQVGGYYGWDLGVFGGVFEDLLGGGLVTFIPK